VERAQRVLNSGASRVYAATTFIPRRAVCPPSSSLLPFSTFHSGARSGAPDRIHVLHIANAREKERERESRGDAGSLSRINRSYPEREMNFHSRSLNPFGITASGSPALFLPPEFGLDFDIASIRARIQRAMRAAGAETHLTPGACERAPAALAFLPFTRVQLCQG